MVYLDYAANTPVDPAVLDVFCQSSLDYYGNPNGRYTPGTEANAQIDAASAQIRELFHIEDYEVIYTSGASEANNLALKGLVRSYRENGGHIISTCLEHSSVSGALTYLQTLGYEIDLVDITPQGQVDLSHLQELLRDDTVLVSVCYVDSELGVQQPVSEIAALLKQYPNCFFHTDATQAVGKIPVWCEDVDLLTFSPHKFYGINGMGVLLKKEEVILEPQIHGGSSTSIYRSGTPVVANAAATAYALERCLSELETRQLKVKELQQYLLEKLSSYPKVCINSTAQTIPYFINLSVQGIKARDMQDALNKQQIYISPKSACSAPNTPSRAVYAVTKNRKNAMCAFRISLSHLLTKEDADEFLKAFELCISQLK